MSLSSPGKETFEASFAELKRVYTELDIPQDIEFDVKGRFDAIIRWKKVLRDELLRICSDSAELIRPLSEERNSREDAYTRAANAFDAEQKRVHLHENAKLPRPEEGKKISTARMDAWQRNHAKWEKERQEVLDSLISKHETLFASAKARSSLKPEDMMDVVVLARQETRLIEEINRIRAMLRAADEAAKTCETNDQVRDTLINAAGDDVQLMEAVTKTLTGESDGKKRSKKKKKSSGIPPAGKEAAAKQVARVRTRDRSRYYFQTTAAAEPDTSLFAETIVTPERKIRTPRATESKDGTIVIHIPIAPGKTIPLSICLDKKQLLAHPLPDAREIAEKIKNLKRSMAAHRDALDGGDRKSYLGEISNASVSYTKILDAARTISETATGKETFHAIIAAAEQALPESTLTANATCQVNAVKQMLLSSLAPSGSDDANVGVFFQAEKLPMIGNLTMNVGVEKVPPMPKEKAISLRPVFEGIVLDRTEEKRFASAIVMATGFYEASVEQRMKDADMYMSVYLGSIEPIIETFIKQTGGDPLWILPNMQACIAKLSHDARGSECLVNRMQHERMARRIAQACLRLIDKIS